MIFGEAIIRKITELKSDTARYPWKDLLINFSVGIDVRITTNLFWTGIMFFAMKMVEQHAQFASIDMKHWWA